MGGLVVCAYSDVGYAQWLFDGRSVRLVFTHATRPARSAGSDPWRTAKARPRVRAVTDLEDPAEADGSPPSAGLPSFYFKKMIPERVLALAKRRPEHARLRPSAFRGRSPDWAILKGATERRVSTT